MNVRKIVSIATIAGILAAATACADVTGPETSSFCQVTGGSQVCTN